VTGKKKPVKFRLILVYGGITEEFTTDVAMEDMPMRHVRMYATIFAAKYKIENPEMLKLEWEPHRSVRYLVREGRVKANP
jgi:hypothetical protein